jgi:ribosomal-protein-alanine N-acetyltransferase
MMYLSKRDFSPETAQRLWEICEESYDHGSPWSARQFAADIEQRLSEYFVLVQEKQWLGFIAYHEIFDEIEINHVVVAKEHQGQGVGQQLLKQAVAHWIRQGFTQAFLEVRASNLSAKKLYEKNGFEFINCRKNYYSHPQEDGFVMCLKLKDVKK